ncbi:MAG TPA: 30S ribosomal protein S7, partial [Hyphomicrobiaceae bacterium]|nr:30S ribosomal protein S7 [Hyphomicrobiaceae bacterium]
MSRRHSAQRREINPDPKFNDLVVSKFMNSIMREGKKSVAENIVYGAFDRIQTRAKTDPLPLFHQALENVMPAVEVRSRRVGGANYQVPMQVKRERQQSLSIRWILAASRGKAGRPMYLRLADELMAAYRREGEAMSKREQTIKMAEANKAFSH